MPTEETLLMNMTWTPVDILYIVLALCAVVLTVFICTMLFHLINILRDAEKTMYKIEETADRVNRFIAQPIKVASQLANGLDTLIGVVQRRFMEQSDDSDE